VTACLRAPGVLTEPLGNGWVVFSALSGETHLVNDESVEVLNALDERSPRSTDEVCRHLAATYEVDVAEIEATLLGSWAGLVEAGLIVQPLGLATSAV
jgi:PqqD family protein of HPr-rel-A system